MAEKIPKKGGGNEGVSEGRSTLRASSRGLGSGLLLGFSTCKAGGAVGKTLIHPLNRLRGVEHLTGEIKFFFDSCKGGLFADVDTVTLSIADEHAPGCWRTITNMLGGKSAGETMVWVYNECAKGYLSEAPTIPGVTAIDITFAIA
jgi:hypothetical protein